MDELGEEPKGQGHIGPSKRMKLGKAYRIK
jgi:hypothetical protein